MPDSSTFACGHAQATDWQRAARECLEQIGPLPPGANLGFVYATDVFASEMPRIYAWLREQTDVAHWTGTVGIAICATRAEYSQTAALAIMIGSLPADSFRVLPFYNRAADNLPANWDPWLQQSPTHVAMVHGDPGNSSVPELLNQLGDALPGGYLIGGLSSSHGAHPQIADDVLEGGLSGVVFNDRINLATVLSQGCSPIADKHTIDACDGNIIDRIDNRPALDVFNEDIGEILARDLNRAAGYIFAGFPIPGSDTGDYLVRNLLGIDTQGKRLAVGEFLHPGQQIQFCRRDAESAREDMQRMLDKLRGRLDGTPRAGLYFSCLGRGGDLFGEPAGELNMIADTLGDFPLVGFFANGEISNRRLYGYTGVLTVFT